MTRSGLHWRTDTAGCWRHCFWCGLSLTESIFLIMVPVMIALLLGSIYGLGELFNLFSAVGGKKS